MIATALVAPAGARIAVTATVTGSGKGQSIGLVLGNQQRVAAGGIALGKGPAW